MSKKVQKVLIPILLIGTAIGAVGFLSKGFKDWNIDSNFNSIKDSLFPTSSSEVDSASETSSEQNLVNTDINFATTFTGITGTIGKQKSDSVANQKLIAYSNQARIYGGKFIVGKTDGDTTSAFADANTLSKCVPLYDQIGQIEVKNVNDVSSKASWCNYVAVQTGAIESEKVLTLKFTYTFDYGSSVNFRIEPFYCNPDATEVATFLQTEGVDRTHSQYISYENVTNDSGKIQQTVTVNMVPFGGVSGLIGGSYDMLGIAIYGLNTDTRLTVNTMKIVTTAELPAHGADFTYYVPNQVEGVKVVSANGIAVRNVATGTDEENHSFVTINYSLTPVNTTDASLTATVGWVNTSITDNASLFLAATLDTQVKTLKVTCLQAFSNQMKVVLSSQLDPTKTATITFDVAQKFLGFNGQKELFVSHYFNSIAINRYFSNQVSNDKLISNLTNGFTATFTTGISTTATVSNYHYSSSATLMYSDEWDDNPATAESVFVSDDNLPLTVQLPQTTALFDDTFDIYPSQKVAKADFISALNTDAAAHWTNDQISFIKNSTNYIALRTSAHFDITVAGVTNNIQVNYLAIIDTYELTLNIPLQSIQPEVSNFTF